MARKHNPGEQEVKMKVKKTMFMVVGLVLLALAAGNCLAQDTVTIKGKIAYLQAEGGYYVQGDSPKEIYIITNQNPKVLAKMKGKTVTITAQLVADSDYIFITGINGNNYQGTKEPVFK
jgi:hypothetical protein